VSAMSSNGFLNTVSPFRFRIDISIKSNYC
jgi:hypothetical protein